MFKKVLLIGFWILLLLSIGLNLLIFFFFSKKEAPKSKRLVVFAGYAEGTMVNYRLELYPDSTYFLSTVSSPVTPNWAMDSDTLLLKQGDHVCAKIWQEKLLDCTCPSHQSLRIMELKWFVPPKVVVYPRPQ